MEKIPFYPAYTIDYKAHSDLKIWWFEKEFSQITYGPSPERGRNACVLITILTAAKIAQKQVKTKSRENDPYTPRHGIVVALAESILEAIEVYSGLKRDGKLTSNNLNIPEAYQALGLKVSEIHEWSSFLYFENLAATLDSLIWNKLNSWNRKSLTVKRYFFVIVIANEKALLIVIDQIDETATFFDSHPHDPFYGCVCAQTRLSNLQNLCHWIGTMFRDYYQTTPTCFELSFFQVRQK